MKFLKKVSAVVKDQNSIYLAKLAKKSDFRNPELETALIKATSHDESHIDYKNSKRIFSWIKTSPSLFLKPVIWSLTTRVEKTRCWIVALKCLMVMHGIFCCKIPAVKKIGRLPFDLSSFNDSKSTSTRGFSAFVRAYFVFLDQKSSFEAQEEENTVKDHNVVLLLDYLRKLQVLLEILLQIRPYGDIKKAVLILEAMDCIVIEVFDIYSRICNGIAQALVKIYSANKAEAKMALSILHKATSQGSDLESYFEFCREIGVLNASEFPKVEQIPDDDIRDLERIIGNATENNDTRREIVTREKDSRAIEKRDIYRNVVIKPKDSRAIETKKDSRNLLTTVITNEWVHFDDEFKVDQGESVCSKGVDCYTNPFVDSISVPPLLCNYNNDIANFNGFLQLEHHAYDSTDGNHRSLMLST